MDIWSKGHDLQATITNDMRPVLHSDYKVKGVCRKRRGKEEACRKDGVQGQETDTETDREELCSVSEML